uniref:Uncharacterized protein n=1 Tax=Rhizophora mucronata TaxID=61149 RepID=A0A2P2P4N4_RHIMU
MGNCYLNCLECLSYDMVVRLLERLSMKMYECVFDVDYNKCYWSCNGF